MSDGLQNAEVEFAIKGFGMPLLLLNKPEDKDLLKQTQLMELAPEGADDVKKQQLMELAIMNGTYRDPQQQNARYHNNNSSSQHSSPSPLSPSLTFDDQEREFYAQQIYMFAVVLHHSL
ncbi:hypothetical protein ACTXT7_005562 [Hymenolepis weldensis]